MLMHNNILPEALGSSINVKRVISPILWTRKRIVREYYVGELDAAPISVKIGGVYSRCSARQQERKEHSLESSALHKFGTKPVSSDIFCVFRLLPPPNIHNTPHKPSRCLSGKAGMTHAGKSLERCSRRKTKS